MRQHRARWRGVVLRGATAACAGAAVALAFDAWSVPRNLTGMEARVAKRWPGIAHLQRAELAVLTDAGRATEIVLIDVRRPEEFAVSHLDGAVQVDPDITREAFLAAHSATLAGKTAVFYCSVGVRSSLLAADVATALQRDHGTRVYNLAGGIFGWHNDARPLWNALGGTADLHGFSRRWSRLVERQSLIRDVPRTDPR